MDKNKFHKSDPKIAIVGGGILGLAAAYFLAKEGVSVSIFEKSAQLGGLSATFPVGSTRLERHHHFICNSDSFVFNLMAELGLDHKIRWGSVPMGFWAENHLWPFSNPWHLLNFKPLPVINRLRFGLSMLYLRKVKNWKPLENISAKSWLSKMAGKKTYETIWGQLMRMKFGSSENEIPVAWLWSRTSRDTRSKKADSFLDHFAYVEDSFQVLIDALVEKISIYGGKFYTNQGIQKIFTKNNKIDYLVDTNEQKHNFERIIFTAPLPVFLSIMDNLPDSYQNRLKQIQYQNIISTVLLLNQSLSPYFWVNISDPKVPFPGWIEFSRLRLPKYLAGNHAVYIPNYLPPGHDLTKLADDELLYLYTQTFKEIIPGFSENWIRAHFISRDPYADPYYTLNYSEKLPPHETPIEGLYLYNTSQIYPYTRNNSNSIRYARKAADLILNRMQKEIL